jgi:hypothetical protein
MLCAQPSPLPPTAATCCLGHYGAGGDEATLYDPDFEGHCHQCNCRDLSDMAGDGYPGAKRE